METRQLKYFVTVAEELHFGNAAKRLHISQPPLSQQIMKFEDELGVRLFERNKRSVSLTAAGRALLEDARGILASLERAESNLHEIVSGRGGRLRLGYISPALETPFTGIIREFKAAYPGVDLSLKEMFTNDQLTALRNHEIDAGIVRLYHHDVSDLEIIAYHRERYSLIVPAEHRFAAQRSVAMAELAGEPLVFFPRESQPRLYDEWMRIFHENGFTPDIVQNAGTKTAALALVAARVGLSIVPESMARRNTDGVVFCQLEGEYPELEFYVVYRKNDDLAALANFSGIVRQVSGLS